MNRIQKLRKDKGLSQLELAKAINVHQTAISQWETEKTNPDMTTIQILADYFNVTVDYLLGRTDAPASVSAAKKPPAEAEGLTDIQRQVYGIIRRLSENQAAQALDYLRYLIDKQENRSK